MKGKTLSRNVLGATVVLAAAFIATGCRPSGAAPGAGHGAMTAPHVTVVPVVAQEVIEWDEFTGRTAALENVEVRPRVSGHIEAVKFKSGQLVKKGDVLFQIDARWYQADFAKREADHEQTRVKMANAEREANRTAALLASKAISTEEGDQRQARYAEAKAALLATQAAKDFAKLDLDQATIRSPIDGRVSREMVTVGNYVSGTPGNATLLTTIVSVDPMHVYADVDENSLLKFNALQKSGKLNDAEGRVPVELQLANEETYQHRGFIESFDNKLDMMSGSIVLRAIFPNPEGNMVPGLFARIRLPASEKKPALLIEESAIGTDQAQKFVLTVTLSNTVAYRPVKLGALIHGKRLVREGLQPGEQVVQNLVMARVRPGMVIQPQVAGTKASDSPVAQAAPSENGAAKSAL